MTFKDAMLNYGQAVEPIAQGGGKNSNLKSAMNMQ